MIIKKLQYNPIMELYASFKSGLMPLAGQYKLRCSSAQNEMNSPIIIFTKVMDCEELFAKCEMLSMIFEYDFKLKKHILCKAQRTYTHDCNDNHLSLLNYLHTNSCIEEVWALIKRNLFIDEGDLLEIYRENSHHKVADLAEIKKTYRDNIIYRYSN